MVKNKIRSQPSIAKKYAYLWITLILFSGSILGQWYFGLYNGSILGREFEGYIRKLAI
jgi:hypothetical protein